MSEKISWYIKRLSLMCPLEFLHRLYNDAFSKYEKLTKDYKEKKAFSFRKINHFYIDLKDIDFIKNCYENNPEKKEDLFKEANKLLNHKFSFFNFNNKNFGKNIDWHKDYNSKKTAPLIYYADLNYKDYKTIGDVKYIWEVNRFQHFFALSTAYALTEKNKYAQQIVSQIEDWIDKNPYLTGINWTSSLEVALRIISWGWAYSLLEICGYNFSNEFKEKFGKSIHLQADYISNHLSAYSSANNHLIGEAAGLVFAGCLFDYGKYSKELRKKGMKILDKEIKKQTFYDGMNKEQALDYHCFVFDFFLTAFLIMQKNNKYVSLDNWDILEKKTDILMRFADNELNLPRIGDSDDGYVIKINEENKLKSIFNTSAALFKRGDFKNKAGDKYDIKTLWLLGKQGYKQYEQTNSCKPQRESKYLNHSGYFLFKDSDKDAFIDVGNPGYLSIAAHGHADTLSFCLNYKNKEFFIDPGTYSYHTQKQWREYFKGTSAHNTVTVDNKNQSERGGNFMWLKKADSVVEEVSSSKDKDYIKASHNGYLKQNIGINHVREVHFEKDKFILIIDALINQDQNKHKFSMNWHTGIDCTVEKSDENYVSIQNGDDTVYMQFLSNLNPDTKIYTENLTPISGWCSKKYDNKEPINTINIKSKFNKNAYIITLISFNEKLKLESNEQEIIVNHNNEKYIYNV